MSCAGRSPSWSGRSTHVELGIGEDEAALTALDELRGGRGTLGRKLTRLETALRAKIDAEG